MERERESFTHMTNQEFDGSICPISESYGREADLTCAQYSTKRPAARGYAAAAAQGP